MAVPRSRLLELLKTQCRIFQTTYNPEGQRLGNKVLRQRLKGPALASYYPRRTVTIKDLRKAFPQFGMWDDDEQDRFEHVAHMKVRGKGAPKKKKEAAKKRFPGSKGARLVAEAKKALAKSATDGGTETTGKTPAS